MEENMLYTPVMPDEVMLEGVDENERKKMVEENKNTVSRIEAEAIKRGCLLYRFLYQPVEQGVAVYQIVAINRISCKIQYCSIDGSQKTMAKQWGKEACVGTEYMMRRIESQDMAMGVGESIKSFKETDSTKAAELAYQLGRWYMYIQTCEEGYDYSIYDESFLLYDGGVYDDDQMDILKVANIILEDMKVELDDLEGTEAVQVDPEIIASAAGSVNAIINDGVDSIILARLIMGNIGDEVALRNICEAQLACMEELTDEEKEYYIETNSFYRSAKEFTYIHNEELEEFKRLLEMGIIVKTSDGYVWKNCV